MNHESFMQLAVELAYNGKGYTKTNPCVGAVVVSGGQVVGKGWHKEFGGNHAEINALHEVGSSAEGADIYVTLEPCSSTGKTPPCVDALIQAGIKRVYIGVLDPNPQHAGRALEILRAAGVEAYCGVYAPACADLIEDFTKFQIDGMPYVTLKTAQSLDGKTVTRSGDSKWISSPESRKLVHKMRKESDAVLTGIGTALADDPELTVRDMLTDRQPARVVFDSRCRLPVTSKLVQGAKAGTAPLIVFVSGQADKVNARALADNGAVIISAGDARIDIVSALKTLGERGFMNVLLESGGILAGAFLDADCVDRIQFFTAPMIIGGAEARSSIGGLGAAALSDAHMLESLACTMSGVDYLFTGKLHDYSVPVLELTARFSRGL